MGDARQILRRCREVVGLCKHIGFKIECLVSDGTRSLDEEVIHAAKVLREEYPSMVVAPLISANFRVARILADIGCDVLRVSGSAIGSRKGIEDRESFQSICKLGLPVMLDGGVGGAKDWRIAERLGASGILINSALFTGTAPPHVLLERFVVESGIHRSKSGPGLMK
jgi:thiazole synthase